MLAREAVEDEDLYSAMDGAPAWGPSESTVPMENGFEQIRNNTMHPSVRLPFSAVQHHASHNALEDPNAIGLLQK